MEQDLQDIKLHEWKQMEAVESHTHYYLRVNEPELDRCVERLVQSDQVEEEEPSIQEQEPSIQEQ